MNKQLPSQIQLSPPRRAAGSLTMGQAPRLPVPAGVASPSAANGPTGSSWTIQAPQSGPDWQKVYPDLADGPLVTGQVYVGAFPVLILSRSATRRIAEVTNYGTAAVEIVFGPDGSYGQGVPIAAGDSKGLSEYIGDIYLVAAPGTPAPGIDCRLLSASAAVVPPQ